MSDSSTIRYIVVGSIFVGVIVYVRYQFHQVIHQITTNNTQLRPIKLGQPETNQSSRTRCIICNGTGRAPSFTLAPGPRGARSAPARACANCRGTGWIDNPSYGR
jgi:hypothetical protein